MNRFKRMANDESAPQEHRRKYSYWLAVATYRLYEKTTTYVDSAGQERSYEPTEQDAKMKQTLSLMSRTITSLRATLVLATLLWIGGVAFGVLTPVPKERT
jgi:hypothetical protein